MKRLFMPLILLLMSLSTVLSAGEVAGLYNSKQLVPAQHSSPTDEQMADGLSRVLVKVSGNRGLLGKPAIQQALAAPKALLRGFEYRRTDLAVTDEKGTQQPAQALSMTFDSALIERLLRSANERPLGAQRPTLMLWLAMEQRNQRDYVSPDSSVLRPLMAQAEARGLPVQLPLLDLTDQQNLPIADLWGLFGNGIEAASVRYRPDATLAGRMVPLPGGNWYVEWLLLGQGGAQKFVTEGAQDDVLTGAIEQVADRLFAALSGSSDSNYMEGLQLDIANVRTLSDYVSVVDYLNKLTLVSRVDVEQVDGERLLLRVQLDGRAEQLERAIRLEPRMVPVDVEVINAVEQQLLRYRWQG